MSYWIDIIGDGFNNPNHIEYSASTDADIADLPTSNAPGNHPDPIVANRLPAPGSGCLVIGSSAYYMLDGADDTWKEL